MDGRIERRVGEMWCVVLALLVSAVLWSTGCVIRLSESGEVGIRIKTGEVSAGLYHKVEGAETARSELDCKSVEDWIRSRYEPMDPMDVTSNGVSEDGK